MLVKLYAHDGTKKEEFMSTLPPPPPSSPLISQEHVLGDNLMLYLSQNFSELMKIPDAEKNTPMMAQEKGKLMSTLPPPPLLPGGCARR